MRLDYDPILDVRAIKEGNQPMGLIPELLKYCVKESDLVADRDWLIEYTHILHQYTRTSIARCQNVRKRAQNNICVNSEHHSPVCPSSTLHIDEIDA